MSPNCVSIILRFDATEIITDGVDATTLCQVPLESGGKPWNLQNSAIAGKMLVGLLGLYHPKNVVFRRCSKSTVNYFKACCCPSFDFNILVYVTSVCNPRVNKY